MTMDNITTDEPVSASSDTVDANMPVSQAQLASFSYLDALLDGLNERQREAVLVPPDCPLQVLAGAGTGKTELISRRFVHLAHTLRERGITNVTERILVVTFTNDAAKSMRERIQQRLQTYSQTSTGVEGEPSNSNASPKRTTQLLSPNCWIGTFHQLCMRIIRQYPLEVGLPPQFSILNPLEQIDLFEGLMAGVMSGERVDVSDVLARYGLAQSLSPQLLSVPALQASGLRDLDTLLESGRLLRLINRIKSAGLSPAEFRTTAREQSQRFTEALLALPVPHEKGMKGPESLRLKISTWGDALRAWAATDWDPIARAEEKGMLEGREPGKMTASLYKAELPGLVTMHLAPRSFEPVSADLSLLEAALLQELALIDIVSALYALYQDALLSQGACDFDDLINHAATLLSRPEIGEQFRQRFEAVIVDEFQDSNGSQLRLLELLTRPHANNLTVVGDEKQSIYGFRFAQPENLDLIFQSAENTFSVNASASPISPVQRISLQTNYRSTQPVLTLANRITDRITTTPNSHLHPAHSPEDAPLIIALNLDAPPESDELESEAGLFGGSVFEKASDGILDPFGVLAGLPAEEPMKTAPKKSAVKSPSRSKIMGQKHKSIDEQRQLESRFIAGEIARLAQTEDCLFSDMAVLVSSHARAEEVQRVLMDYGIPSVRQKNLGFFEEPIIKTAMALLRVVRKPSDVTSLTRLLQTKLNLRQVRGVLMWALAQVKAGENRTVTEACALLKISLESLGDVVPLRVAEAVGDLASRLLTARRLRFELTGEALFEKLAQPLGLIQPHLPQWQQKEQRIRLRTFGRLLQALRLNRRNGSSLPMFDDWMTTLERYAANPKLDLPVTEDPGDEDAVRIMTTFASKGLEFKVVFAACTEIARLSRAGDDAAVAFDPQYAGKNGFGLILGKVDRLPNIKREIYRKCWVEPRAERETQRVFYVALTRARERLYLIRGSRSFPWTDFTEDAADACADAVLVLSETQDADYLQENYWSQKPSLVRQALEALQEKRASENR
jgi:superfamily I DNA/RNA helicase